MKNTLFINRVTTEPKINKFDVQLTKGLNIIFAQDVGGKGAVNSVGKSTFVKLIDYGLGSNSFLKSESAKKQLKNTYLLMEFSVNNTKTTIKRNLIKGTVCEVYDGWVIDKLLLNPSYTGEKMDNGDYKSRLESLLFSNKNYYKDKKILSIRQILSQLIRVQGSGFEAIDKPLGINESANIRRQRLEFLTGLLSEEEKHLNHEIEQAEEREKDLKKQYQIIEGYIRHKTIKYEFELKEELSQLEFQIGNIEQNLEDERYELVKIYERQDELKKEKQKNIKIINEIQEKISAYKLRTLNYTTTCNEIENESESIDFTIRSMEWFKRYPHKKCPTCLRPLKYDDNEKCLLHEVGASDMAIETIKQVLENEKKELQESISFYEDQIKQLVKEKSDVQKLVNEINGRMAKEIDTVIENITNLEGKKEELQKELMSINIQMNSLNDVNRYQKEWSDEKDTLEILRKDLKSYQEGTQVRLQSLSTYYDEIVRFLYNDTKKGILDLSPRAKNIQVKIINNDGVGEEDTGDATKIMKVVAFDLALLKLAESSEVMHPKFLIHDSPNVRDVDPEVYKRIMSYILELEREIVDIDFQYIITTLLLPEDIKENSEYIKLKLNNNGEEGKLFGFSF
ncbi:hypothetical protein COL48_12300 [Bacillus toyonensis]|uniref:DUF2326 domain-containing protein n=1 Tax=Bacillus cereus group TaxID=86661 RepID=UPI000BF9BCAD|nr:MULTISPECIES: DUF2326 domain-containing protein [Bacillus cereus group]MBD8074069.1 DUF2326 domain-containing protein [Bacillus thuringiensis]PFY32516.1 hypothetical protein COL48_12300 [Bacillus toyonensis]